MTLEEQLETLTKARQWLDDPAHWCQKHAWEDAKGNNLGISMSDMSDVTRTCAYGALLYTSPNLMVVPLRVNIQALLKQLRQNCPNGYDIFATNDNLGYEATINVYDKAIAHLEELLSEPEVIPEPELIPV